MYTINADTTRKRVLFLQDRFNFTLLVLEIGIAAYIVVGIGHTTRPIYAYLQNGELKPMISLYLPFIDEHTTNGFIILTTDHMFSLLYAFLGTTSSDFLAIALTINFPLFTTALDDNIVDFNKILHRKNVDAALVKERLQKIFDQYQEIWM